MFIGDIVYEHHTVGDTAKRVADGGDRPFEPVASAGTVLPLNRIGILASPHDVFPVFRGNLDWKRDLPVVDERPGRHIGKCAAGHLQHRGIGENNVSLAADEQKPFADLMGDLHEYLREKALFGFTRKLLDLAQQKLFLDRFGDKRIGLAFNGLDQKMGLVVRGGDDHRGQIVILSYSAQHLKPVHHRHLDIGDNNVGVMGMVQFKPL